jgi:hypothetical protein
MKMPTRKQRDAEVERLINVIAGTNRQFGSFDAINRQIQVLQDELMAEDVEMIYEVEEWPMEEVLAAFKAVAWLDGDRDGGLAEEWEKSGN